MATDRLLLLPTLNEEEALKALAAEIPEDMDVLVVDGGSVDGTGRVAESLGYKFIGQKFGKGKGCGVRTGLEYFLASDYRYLAMIDADYTNDPREVPGMIQALAQGSDIVLGSRDKRLQIEHLGRFSLFVNLSTAALTSLAYGLDLPDIQTGYWAFSRKAAETLYPKLRAGGFEIEYDVVYNSWREGLRIGYRPVTFRRRIGESKFTVYLRFKQIYHGLTYVGKSLGLMLKQRLTGGTSKPGPGDTKQQP
jgi:glycosyltransferase involved in cell wall biosynthesis